MYKLIACDLDETLIKPDRTIDSRDIEAIKKLKDLGVKFVLATGRGYNTVQGTLKELDLFDEANQYVISYNGGAITENKDNRLLHFEGISFEKAEELYRRGLKYDVVIHVYTRDAVYLPVKIRSIFSLRTRSLLSLGFTTVCSQTFSIKEKRISAMAAL